jgi:hypothetical protein
MTSRIKLIWFSSAIILGAIVGRSLNEPFHVKQTTPTALIATNADSSRRPSFVKVSPHDGSETQGLSVSQMDKAYEVPVGADQNFMLRAWFDGDRKRLNFAHSKMDELLAYNPGRTSSGPANTRVLFRAARSEEDKKRIFHTWTRERLYTMIYTYEVAKLFAYGEPDGAEASTDHKTSPYNANLGSSANSASSVLPPLPIQLIP